VEFTKLNMNNFLNLINCDTDSITVSKYNGEPFSKEEQEKLLKELNSIFPETIRWAPDGEYSKFIVLKAKNYVMFTLDGKLKTKGSAIRDQKREKRIRDFINEIIDAMVFDKTNYTEIYLKYIKEVNNIREVKPWTSKKTITTKVLNPKRTNEQKVFDIISNTDYREGDKIWVFFKEDGNLELAENFKGEYNKMKLLEKLHSSAQIFENVLNTKELFKNYSLKRHKEELQEIWK